MKLIDSIITLLVVIGVTLVAFTTPANFEPCPTEDSNWCYWDGGTNHKGDHFIALTDNFIIRL